MERQIKIIVTDTVLLTERVIDFFKQFDFKLTDKKDGYLKFNQNASLLDAWKTNPLKWGSEISVSIADNNIVANFCVETDAQMKTNEEEIVWLTFIDNFQSYLTNGKTSNQQLRSTILDNKKSRLSYFSWTMLGAITGGLLSFLYKKLTEDNSNLSVFLIPVVATFFLSRRINFVKTKNVL